SPLNDAMPPLAASSRGNDPGARRMAARDSSIESRKLASASRRSASSARPSTASTAIICGSSLVALSGNSPCAATYFVASVVAPGAGAPCRGALAGCSRARRWGPMGWSAKVFTASTMRSNSSARRAASCIRGTPDLTTRSWLMADLIWRRAYGLYPSTINPPPYEISHQRSAMSEMVDQRRNRSGSEPVVDVHHRDAVGAAVEHPEERGQAPEARPVPDARRHSDDRDADKPCDDARQRPLHPGDDDDHPRGAEALVLAQQPVQTRDADVVQPADRVAHHLRGTRCLFCNRQVRRPSRGDHDRAVPGTYVLLTERDHG